MGKHSFTHIFLATSRRQRLAGASSLALAVGLSLATPAHGQLVPLRAERDPVGIQLYRNPPPIGTSPAALTGGGGRNLYQGEGYTNIGTIMGDPDGVYGAGDNSLTNAATGSIYGTINGVNLSGSLGTSTTMVNSGAISGGRNGVYLAGSSVNDGLAFGTGRLINSGYIQGLDRQGIYAVGASSYNGDAFGTLGFTNSASGTVTGSLRGVHLAGAYARYGYANGVLIGTNSGAIFSTGEDAEAALVATGAQGTNANATGTLTFVNRSTGTISAQDAGVGVYLYGANATYDATGIVNFSNAGVIASNSDAGIVALGAVSYVAGNAIGTVNFSNGKTGVVTGGYEGIDLDGASAFNGYAIGMVRFTNAGMISTSGGSGVYAFGAKANGFAKGSIVIANQADGIVMGNAYGIKLVGASSSANGLANAVGLISLSNAGIVQGETLGVGMVAAVANTGIANGTGLLSNSGTIEGTFNGAYLTGAMTDYTAMVVGQVRVTNAGDILGDGAGSAGLVAFGARTNFLPDDAFFPGRGAYGQVVISNQSTGTIAGGNFGISAIGGLGLANGASGTVEISNAGFLAGSAEGILTRGALTSIGDATGRAAVTNSGTVMGAVYVVGANSGRATAVGSVSVANSGAIADELFAVGAFTGMGVARGIIAVTNDARIINSTIAAAYVAGAVAQNNEATGAGQLSNNGTIEGGRFGVEAFGARVVRAGTATGTIALENRQGGLISATAARGAGIYATGALNNNLGAAKGAVSVSNDGAVTSANIGAMLSGATIGLGVAEGIAILDNAGTIESYRGVYAMGASADIGTAIGTIRVTNGGEILSRSQFALFARGASVITGTATGTVAIVNTGHITASSTQAMDGLVFDVGTGIYATGAMVARSAPDAVGTASVTNTGLVSGLQRGIYASGVRSFGGSATGTALVTNSGIVKSLGTIAGDGVTLANGMGISIRGAFGGGAGLTTGTAVFVNDGGTVMGNDLGARVVGASSGGGYATGTVVASNSGVILGGNVGFFAYGARSAVDGAAGHVSINNSNLIMGTGVLSVGLRVEGAYVNATQSSTATIAVANTGGTIGGGLMGLYLVHAYGATTSETSTIINSGLIAGSNATMGMGIVSAIDGIIVNTGAIRGAAAGIVGYVVVGDDKTRYDAALTITNAGTIAGGAVGMAIAFGAKDDTLILETGSVLEGNVSAGDGTDALVVRGTGGEDSSFFGFETLSVEAGADYVFGGYVQASVGEIKAGALHVDGTLVGFDGSDTLAGTDLKVDAGGVLAGNGLVIGDVVADGTIAPGNSIGTLHVAGDVRFDKGSTLVVEMDRTGASDLLAVAKSDLTGGDGNVVIDGGMVVVATGPNGVAKTTVYDIIHAQGTVAGTFDGITDSLAFFDASLSYDPDDVFVTLARNEVTFKSLSGTGNQSSAGGALDRIERSGTIPGGLNRVFTGLFNLTTAGISDALDQLSGDAHASLESALLDTGSRFIGGISAHQGAVRAGTPESASAGGFTGGQFAAADAGALATDIGSTLQVAAANGATDGPITQALGTPSHVWARPYGFNDTIDGDSKTGGVSSQGGGIAAGLDVDVTENLTAGLALGYEHQNLDLTGRNGASGDVDSFSAGLYGDFLSGPFHLDGIVAYTRDRVTTRRPESFGGFNATPKADYDADEFTAYGETGYSINLGLLSVEPIAALDYRYLSREGFTEHGGKGADLKVKSDSTNSLRSIIGLRLSKTFNLETGWTVAPEVRGGYSHEYLDDHATIGASFAADPAGTGFQVQGVEADRNAALIGGGITILSPAKDVNIFLDYGGRFSGNTAENVGSVGVRFTW